MGRRKKLAFKLNPEWMLKEPLDFEYNKYTLLDYIQKCEKNLDNFEIILTLLSYPFTLPISNHYTKKIPYYLRTKNLIHMMMKSC